MKSYQQFCAVARALDVIGDRWTLLIVRELLIRPCRYTDLRDGLPGIATNLLAERLRQLEAAGVVQREDPAPPVATTVYRLTERGEQLRPVVQQVLRWGAQLMMEPVGEDEFRSRWLVHPVETFLNPREPVGDDLVVQLETGDEPLVVEASGGQVRARTGTAPEPDAVLRGPPDAILGLVMGFVDLDSPEGRAVTIEGDRTAVTRLRTGGSRLKRQRRAR